MDSSLVLPTGEKKPNQVILVVEPLVFDQNTAKSEEFQRLASMLNSLPFNQSTRA